jgi:excinuclease ABC subunit A
VERFLHENVPALKAQIVIKGARTHNLKGIDCTIPHRKLTVITGVSGSGKSSLAFDTIYGEGHRRYLQTLSTYARQYLDQIRRPLVDAIRNIPPTLAIRQCNASSQPRSTVATMTELAEHLGLLFVAIGEILCTNCGEGVRTETPITVARSILAQLEGQSIVLAADLAPGDSLEETLQRLAREGHSRLVIDGSMRRLDETAPADLPKGPLVVVIDRMTVREPVARLIDSVERAFELGEGSLRVLDRDMEPIRRYYGALRCNGCGTQYPMLTPGLFSFNSAFGACNNCNGFGRAMGLDYDRVVPDPSLSVSGGAIAPFLLPRGRIHQQGLTKLCRRHGISIETPWARLSTADRRLILHGDDAFAGVAGFFKALQNDRYKADAGLLLSQYRRYTICPACDGSRLSPESRAVRLRDVDIGRLTALTIDDAITFFETLQLTNEEKQRASELPGEIQRRLTALAQVGLGYLNLDRMTRTLSAGEYQRMRLASCLGRGLVDACYVLDEPTTGLHPRDTSRLINMLHELRDLGNTVVVVEHEELVIEAADHILELGPGGGERGGQVVFEGSVDALRKADTATAAALRGIVLKNASDEIRATSALLTVVGACHNNLKFVDAAFPINAFSVITGVSGSGKTTLLYDVIEPGVSGILRRVDLDFRRCRAITNAEMFGRVEALQRSTSGLTARSTVLSFSGALEPLRRELAGIPTARERGLSSFHFSTNVRGGRCDRCEGLGVRRIDMHFMADVEIVCEVCEGLQFKPTVLEVRLRGLNIAEIHRLTATEALSRFSDHPKIVRLLQPLHDLGLGYLRLGQPTQTLSGGELQRLRIAEHLTERRGRGLPTLFLFDEPSVGLHAADISRLLDVFARLCAEGHTVIAVEHNLDIVSAADWVVDLGPESGDAGGEIVVVGSPREVAACPESHTGRFLAKRAAGG